MIAILEKNYRLILACIIAFAFLTRVIHVSQPPAYIFDEVYHAITAKLIARNDSRAYEWWNEPVEPNTAVDWLHPPVAKYFQAVSISIFGENSFGWRFSSVVFGTLVVFLLARLTDALFNNKPLALLAAFLASLDGLLLVQSRIAMNDIHVTFFILLTAFMYIKHKNSTIKKPLQVSSFLILTGITAGVAMATKWSGIYILAPIYLYELLVLISQKKQLLQTKLKFIFQRFILLTLLPICIYVSSYAHMFAQGKTLFCNQEVYIQGQCYYEEFILPFSQNVWRGYVSHFVELHRQIWWYQTHLEATHSYQSRPWEWFLNLRPVWIHVIYSGDARADIYSQGNTILFWLGAASVIALALLLVQKISQLPINKLARSWEQSNLSRIGFVFLAYLSVWVPWQFSPRIMFFYHYTPAVPFMCLLIAYLLYYCYEQVKGTERESIFKTVSITLVGLIILNFFLFYPNWTGMMVSNEIKNSIHFALDSWK